MSRAEQSMAVGAKAEHCPRGQSKAQEARPKGRILLYIYIYIYIERERERENIEIQVYPRIEYKITSKE